MLPPQVTLVMEYSEVGPSSPHLFAALEHKKGGALRHPLVVHIA
jgi:hypothetical protein